MKKEMKDFFWCLMVRGWCFEKSFQTIVVIFSNLPPLVKPHSVLLPLVYGTSQALKKGKRHQLFTLLATHIPHVSLLVLINCGLRYVRCLAEADSLSPDASMALPCSRLLAAQACSYGFWQSLPQINSSLSLLLSNASYFCPFTCSFPHPSLFQGNSSLLILWGLVARAQHRQWKGIPTKSVQVIIGLSVWNHLSAGLRHWPRSYILFCNWCPCCQMSLQAGRSRQNLQDSPRFQLM